MVRLVNRYKSATSSSSALTTWTFRGKAPLRPSGSAGTHNGMRNIIYLLGRDDFPRLRVGIGRPPEGWDLKDYVLTGYRTPAERQTMFDAFVAAAETVERLIASGNDAARARVAEYNNG